MLIKVKLSKENAPVWNTIKHKIKGNILLEDKDKVIVEIVGDTHFIKEQVALLKPAGIAELVRTGRIAIAV